MADGSVDTSVKTRVGEAEWRARVDLAALYRLTAMHGWDDMIFTHISARVPGPEHHFLINPYGMFFGEMTASCLVKVDLDGNLVEAAPGQFINPAGFTIHSAVHAARPEINFVIHLHTDHGVAVSTHREGLLPLTQHALIALPHLAYHGYEGVALKLEERERLVADLGDKHLMILRNHGTLAAGATAADAWMGMFYLERACLQQVLAMTAGKDALLMASKEIQDEVRQQTAGMAQIAALSWPGLLRSVDRAMPGYDA